MTRTTPGYPPAERIDLVEQPHGIPIADPYRWLEDPADPRTVDWTTRQDELYADWAADRPEIAGWRARIAALSANRAESVPVRCGTRFFRLVREPGAEHAVLVVRDGSRDRVLLDPSALDPTGATVLESWQPSADGQLLAVQLSSGGTEDCLLTVLDVDTGEVLDGPHDRVRSSPIGWLPDSTAFYYVRRLAPELVPGEERYHRRVYRHVLGTDASTDLLVFGAGRSRTQFYDLAVAPDGRWLALTATEGADPDTELWLADLRPTGTPTPRPVQVGGAAATRLEFGPDTAGHAPIWLRTDLDAPHGRVVVATIGEPTPADWRELIPERPGAVLTDFSTLHGHELSRPVGLAMWTRHAVGEITVHDLTDGREIGTVPLPGIGTVENLTVPPVDSHQAWFRYTDQLTPPAVLCFDARTGRTTGWPEPTAQLTALDLHSRQLGFRSADGTTVRMFVLSATAAPDRPRPAILTGYAGFGVPMRPGYLPHALAWVRAGGIYAVAGPRGGGEEGRHWHRAGRGALKQNGFDDFDAAGDALVRAGWTSRDQLGILGGSNGGLLVGAALTQHPAKYAAVVSMSALLDMVRYERSGLGPSWRSEYGSAEHPDELRVLLGYSPYHRVDPGTRYPPTLLTVAAADTRVDPLHARKMCAALQHASTAPPTEAPVLLRVEHDAGHGTRTLARTTDLFADVLAFLGRHLGLTP
ncbi:MAG TPA: prolyl oligopeptidase family serine peptidase [Pseudonocardiaceae bacterium]|jgi:prolyl oligopeptidase|nr:prolyl oligopeptidase family serine peptidase [Pseudonocardiaceae bacterium]